MGYPGLKHRYTGETDICVVGGGGGGKREAKSGETIGTRLEGGRGKTLRLRRLPRRALVEIQEGPPFSEVGVGGPPS